MSLRDKNTEFDAHPEEKKNYPGRRGFLKALTAAFLSPIVAKAVSPEEIVKKAPISPPCVPKIRIDDYYNGVSSVSGIFPLGWRSTFPSNIYSGYNPPVITGRMTED